MEKKVEDLFQEQKFGRSLKNLAPPKQQYLWRACCLAMAIAQATDEFAE